LLNARFRGDECREMLLAALLALAAMGAAAPAHAAEVAHLYEGRAFVTGQDEADRGRGFALCLDEVLVKLSGDERLLGDPRLKALETKAGSMVRAFDYHDRMAGLPLHDEQGTRERPYDLHASFDPAKVDHALGLLGLAPWAADRPRIAIVLGVRDAEQAYVLASDGARGLGQRQSLAATAERRGLPLVVPSRAQLRQAGVDFEHVASGPPETVAAALGGDVALEGTLVWSEPELGWAAEWRLAWRGRAHRWQIRGVSFDDAFRNALGGAAQILSGHGQPD
jgi:hypothetical protein